MTLELLQVADRCDGMRCDMAMLLIREIFEETWGEHPCRVKAEEGEFWEAAIRALREQHPRLLLIAEAYWNREKELIQLGFDYAYQKSIADALFDEPSAVQRLALEADWLDRGVHFLENHDERRAAGRLDPDPHRAAAFAMLTLPGLRLLQDGQLDGAKVRTPVQLGRRRMESPDPAVQGLYARLLSALLPAEEQGRSPKLLAARRAWDDNPTAEWFILVQWQDGTDGFCLAVTNLAPHRSQCYAPLSVPGLAAHDWRLSDLLGEERYERSGEELQRQGLFLDVPAHATQLFHFAPFRGVSPHH
jgi:hypothetical protein